MEKLIEALKIFLKYDNPEFPTHCEHDTLYICGKYNPKDMNGDDVYKLRKMGFQYDDDGWYSYRYGSC